MESENRFLAFFSRNPWVGVIATLCSLVSLPLSFVFFFASVREPGLVVAVRPRPMEIISPHERTSLRVELNGREVTGSVTAVRMAIWNQGREPIGRAHIRRPIVISTDSAAILSASLQPIPGGTAARFSIDSTHLAAGRVGVSWDLMEKNEGTYLDLLLSGVPETRLSVRGRILGQGEIPFFEHRWALSSSEKEHGIMRWRRAVVPPLIGTFAVGLAACLVLAHAEKRARQRRDLLLVAATLVLLIGYFAVIYRMSWYSVPSF